MPVNKIMDEKYWDKVAVDYDGEIFSALASDRSDVIASTISRFGSKQAVACDFGCGVGKFLPILAENFRHVYAIDISEKLLSQARDNCKDLDNVSYWKKDLSQARVKLEKIDFALSVSVMIMTCGKKRTAILDAISRHLRKEALFVLVVPSLESALYADFWLVQWNLKAGLTGAEAIWELGDGNNGENCSLRQGIVDIDDVPTKHYLKEELEALFERRPFDILSIEKVEYPWRTEFDHPPRWMNEPYPWDWLVVLKKN